MPFFLLKNTGEKYESIRISQSILVSSELIALLCENLNHKSLDEDDQIFHSVTSSESKNYCPIAFFKFIGHCFLTNDKSIISSTAETNSKPHVGLFPYLLFLMSSVVVVYVSRELCLGTT